MSDLVNNLASMIILLRQGKTNLPKNKGVPSSGTPMYIRGMDSGGCNAPNAAESNSSNTVGPLRYGLPNEVVRSVYGVVDGMRIQQWYS